MQNNRGFVLGLLLASQSLFNIYQVHAQPSPSMQKRISAAIASAANQSHPDYTTFVNPFIGTGMLLYVSIMPVTYFNLERQLWRCMVSRRS